MINSIWILAAVGLFAGIIGAIFGIGGGMLVTPIMTIALGLDIKYAIGASVISVIATSSGASIAYLKDDMLNLRVSMFLEIATTVGAILGAILTGILAPQIIYILFGLLLIFSSWNMLIKMRAGSKDIKKVSPDNLSEKLKLNSSYYDKASARQVDYQVSNVPGGFTMMFGAGLASGLLGIGSGAFKVIAMDAIMKMPLKPSSATSNLMMGVTAATSATIYFFNGSIKPEIAAPLALGILTGATLGSRLMQHLEAKLLRKIFIPILFLIGLQMFLKGFGVNFG